MSVRLLSAIAAASIAFFATCACARADDGYDAPFAHAVRTATERYRLAIWARADGYIQSTDSVAGVGTMYTNHDDFNPSDLAHPTVLVFNEAGQLVACGYQFARTVVPGADFSTVPPAAWYDIPRHLHYNITVGGKAYYAQAAWDDDAQPSAPELIRRGLMPADGTLLFAFVHPQTRALLVWAWAPNASGLFSGENSTQP
ncbi:MAG TPA: hypothetical protein VJN22_08305 [Candidatus Eremiobacteraceae bacterium]|nr:hypothetical protein [Candidatus Eremiobacteraceae bacterium]